jgi:hypothetical protein
MWAQIAGLAVNALGQDQQKRQQEILAEKQAQRDTLSANRAWQDQQKMNVEQDIMNQRGNTTQQKVFNDIMQKYNVRL